MNELIKILQKNKSGEAIGIYSVCCAHPLVIEAPIKQGLKDDSLVLIEATANQVNQFGGYTGMQPSDFVTFVSNIANRLGYPINRLILGGDHLGPTCWVKESASAAMDKSKVLIEAYVAAGFKKIHLDTSMQCADDEVPLTDEIVATRAAELCTVAETTVKRVFGKSDISYIIGTEVPPPGGTKEEASSSSVTPVENAQATLDTHKKIFIQHGLEDAFKRVIGMVVQPGVEFNNFKVFIYNSAKAQPLKDFVASVDNLVFEAHSTDYQPAISYQELIKDHFAILKVGPQLTFALREALFALSYIEQELTAPDAQSELISVCEKVMLDDTNDWQCFYPSDSAHLKLYKRYSFSDRIRYYWHRPEIKAAIDKLLNNLTEQPIPLPLLSQFMPYQYEDVLLGELKNSPIDLILHKIMQVTDTYAKACYFQSSDEASS